MRQIAETFPARVFCREEMAERGLTEGEVGATVRRWLVEGAPLTPRVAQVLSVLFGTSAELWLNLDRLDREGAA